jgi:Zn-dependent protease with chaperone function/uncharacterized RDD family membrane protein YckC
MPQISMPDNPEMVATRRRLDPFVFPSDTTFRFILLIAAVLASSLVVFGHKLPPDTDSDSALKTCVIHMNQAMSALCPQETASTYSERAELWQSCGDANPDLARKLDPIIEEYRQCSASLLRFSGFKMIFGGILLWAIAAGIYWFFPSWKIRCSKLVPLSYSDVPEIVSYLSDLCREIGFAHPPQFLWNPLNPAITGLAFGRVRHYYVALSGGLVTRFHTDRPAFRAIVLHELAHIYNGDINKTYFAVSTWYAFLVMAVTSLSSDIFSNSWKDVLAYSWRLAAVTALVYTTRNSILRAREKYADVRVVLWDGSDSALGRVLQKLPRRSLTAAWRWLALLDMHPDAVERRRTLNNPQMLFRLSYGEAFGAGIVIMVAFTSIYQVFRLLVLDLPDFLLMLHAAGASLLVAPLAIGGVTLGIWRSNIAAAGRSEKALPVARLAMAITLGMSIGDIISFARTVSLPRTFIAEIITYGFVGIWYVGLFFCFYLFLRWVVLVSSIWNTGNGAGSVTLNFIGLITSVSVFFAFWFGILYLFRDGIDSIWGFETSAYEHVMRTISRLFVAAKTASEFIPLAICFVWMIPLFGLSLQRQAVPSVSSPAGFEAQAVRPSTSMKVVLRPGLALTFGLIAGSISCIPFVPFSIRVLSPSADWMRELESVATQDALDRFWLSQTFMQIIIAGLVSHKIKPLGWAHGMLATTVVGCMAFGAALLPVHILGLPIDQDLFSLYSGFVALGSAGGLLIALSSDGIIGWFRALPSMSVHSLGPQDILATKSSPLGLRSIAFLIDVVVWYVLSQTAVILAFPVGAILARKFPTGDIDMLLNLYTEANLLILYFIMFEWLFGATIGKFLVGVCVIRVDGTPCSFKAAVVRNLMRCLDIILFCIPTYVTRQAPLEQSIGDRIAKTIVIKIPKQPGAWKKLVFTGTLYTVVNVLIKQFPLVSAFH